MFRLGPRSAAAILLFGAVAPLWAGIGPESGSFLFQTYPAKVYAAAHPQNWAVVEDARGVMYFANTNGVLEYDGQYWRLIPLSNRSGVRSLAVDAKGTVYVGGQGVFGYLAPDDKGAMQFVSLLNRVPQADREFGDVWNVLPTSSGVYFASRRRVFLVSNTAAVDVWRPKDRFGRAFESGGKLYITSTDQGLLTLRGADLVPVPGADLTLTRGVVIFAPGKQPLLANSQKLYRFNQGSIEPFSTTAESYFAEHPISSMRRLASGEIAVGTNNGGLVLLDEGGVLERVIHKSEGLPTDWVTNLYQDRHGGIWLTSDNGISRFAPSLTSFGDAQGLHGNVLSIARLAGSLYTGTFSGLFRIRTASGQSASFEPVAGLQQAIWVMTEHGGMSFVGAQQGLYSLSGTRAQQLLAAEIVNDIAFSGRDPNLLYIAGRDGVQVLEYTANVWKVLAQERGAGQEFRMVAEDADGRVWATTNLDIWRFDFRSKPTKVEQFQTSNGVPPGWNSVYSLRGHVVFATGKGLLRFSESERAFRPDAELGAQFSDGTKEVFLVREDSNKNIWITGKGYHGVLRSAPSGYLWYPMPLLQSGIEEMYTLHVDRDGTCFAAGESGILFRLEPAQARTPSADFQVLLRRVTIAGRKTPLFEGDARLAVPPRVRYQDNALRFEFSAPFYEDESSVQYQVWLEGNETQWSAWNTEARKDYTNLPEHAYTFHVRARDPRNNVSPEAVFPFEVLAPWYRTWWAYMIYAGAFLAAGWQILRWRLRALKAKNAWLEQVVEERTAEVRTERDQNEALLLNILPSPVASELRSTGSVKPATFDDVTVCFSDIVGFTLSSEKLPAQELISSLNRYFTAFDEIIGRYGLEKLKTIGDGYMFAGGLPAPRPSHAVDAVLAAMEMVAVARKLAHPERGVNWTIRIGLYSGPVVAGVVGSRKFAFDIWGDTVNFASRMESSGAPDRVNLSETTYSRVAEFIECAPRGRVRIKEGRELEMYFALRPKPELLAGPLRDGVPETFRAKYEQAFAEAPKSFPNMAMFELDSLLAGRSKL